jgi:hypothetical protein
MSPRTESEGSVRIALEGWNNTSTPTTVIEVLFVLTKLLKSVSTEK